MVMPPPTKPTCLNYKAVELACQAGAPQEGFQTQNVLVSTSKPSSWLLLVDVSTTKPLSWLVRLVLGEEVSPGALVSTTKPLSWLVTGYEGS